MGLRFRKSVTLCKGVRLNFGKDSMSVSVGGNGFRKTFNTKGKVTTSVGLPGTGIYYTDTRQMGSQREVNQISRPTMPQDSSRNRYRDSFKESPKNNSESFAESYEMERENPVAQVNLRDLYKTCDEAIDWTELLVSASCEELFMEKETWEFLKKNARSVLAGDIDAYLETIERMRPVDDLLEYGSDFEFGTDHPNTMEVEFRMNSRSLLSQEEINSCCIRIARDLFALLPVKYVVVYAKEKKESVFTARYDKKTMLDVNFASETATHIMSRFQS